MTGAASRAVQAASRPAVWVDCRCGHEWQSRAKDRMTIRCPECGTGQRVPYRTHANTGPSPERYRPPAPPRAASVRRPATVWEPDDEWEAPEPARPSLPAWPRSGGGLAGILAAFATRTPAAPAPARRSAAPPPARPARPAVPNPPAPLPALPAGALVQPVDVPALGAREENRRTRACQMVRSVSVRGPLLLWYDQPIGLCEALDTTQPKDRQRCPGAATHAVRFRQDSTEADAYTCPAHARPLAALADHAVYVTAAIYPLR
ncbi:hypothetical protein [Streptomyces mirabilis]|uniref:hypothetical protein n=1 Tax=Streptomyces mirabilis TaxID=68239 RepID=UPI00225B8184|nr:hypothetical protein [Streptomyces mirabilis]MCX4429454.1 hypothetical protein [Streptomyces mirabilis]